MTDALLGKQGKTNSAQAHNLVAQWGMNRLRGVIIARLLYKNIIPHVNIDIFTLCLHISHPSFRDVSHGRQD